MLKSFRGREIQVGQEVLVYFNLHTHLFSVKDAKSGLVLAHGNHVQLKDAGFKVLESGRQKVLKEKRKNVHSYITGIYQGSTEDAPEVTGMDKAYYNPYVTEYWMLNGEKAEGEGLTAILTDKAVWVK